MFYRHIALFALFALLIGSPAYAQSDAELIDRIQRMEAQLRQMNGRIEELQFRNRELDAQVKRMQSDAEFRFGELEKGRAGGAARPPVQPQAPVTQPPQRRSDAFDPQQQPQILAPGVGSPASGTAATPRPGVGVAPMDLGQMSQNALNNPSLAPGAGTVNQQIIASATPKEEYDQSVALMQRRDYEAAEQGFRSFVQRNPRNALAGDAYYQIGETYYQRRQFRDAAESYLKVTTDYPRASRAASSLLRLGQSLYGLGEKESACAAYAELNRKYPGSTAVIASAKSEQARAKC